MMHRNMRHLRVAQSAAARIASPETGMRDRDEAPLAIGDPYADLSRLQPAKRNLVSTEIIAVPFLMLKMALKGCSFQVPAL